MSEYKSCPYTVPVNHRAHQLVKIKQLHIRMMKWSAWVNDEHIPNREIDKDKWQHRFTFTLRCQKKAGRLREDELNQLNYYWKIYEEGNNT